jgi:spermidine/putrescine transport system substrate-binding protein
MPWIMRDSRAASRELRIMMWSDYLPEAFRKAFERETGLTIVHTPYGSNEELLSRLGATRGRQFDLVSPTSHIVGQWKELNLLLPLDLERLPVGNLDSRMLAAGEGFAWDGRMRLMPYLSGTEGVSWRTDRVAKEFNARTYGEIGLGDIWQADMLGGVMGRPHSLMAGIGRLLAAEGKLPPFEDSYRNPESMHAIWYEITDFAISHKTWIKQFWDGADAQVDGFARNGVVIGQTWDGPVLRLIRDGAPMRFVAPKEGAFSWVDGMAIPVGAKNIDGAYAFMEFALRPKMSALLAAQTGYMPVAKGADAHLDRKYRQVLAEAYPGDSRERLWHWPPTPVWYVRARGQYVDQFVTA